VFLNIIIHQQRVDCCGYIGLTCRKCSVYNLLLCCNWYRFW